jgi:hypothetical protein
MGIKIYLSINNLYSDNNVIGPRGCLSIAKANWKTLAVLILSTNISNKPIIMWETVDVDS